MGRAPVRGDVDTCRRLWAVLKPMRAWIAADDRDRNRRGIVLLARECHLGDLDSLRAATNHTQRCHMPNIATPLVT
jgi:hypothetical protein